MASETVLASGPISRVERAAYRPSNREDCYQHLSAYFDSFAPSRDKWRKTNSGYHAEVLRMYRYHIPEGARVLEVGCATGDLLAALKPAYGLGVDLSEEMVKAASKKYSQLRFEHASIEEYAAGSKVEKFDYIVLSDLLAFAYDILDVFKALRALCHARTRIIINIYSRLWEPLLALAESTGMKYRQPALNWVTVNDVRDLLGLANLEVISTNSRIICPVNAGVLSRFANSVIAPFSPFRWFCLSNWIVARMPMVLAAEPARQSSVTVVCPCRNEAGNIPHVVSRLQQMGSNTELIFVEGHSKDETLAACHKVKADHPELDISVYQQSGKGKKDAVWLGFEKAKGDILMILDADLTVPPEDLPAFYGAIVSGQAEFVNGSRFVYPMEGKAMRFLNLFGNKFFSFVFSSLIEQNVKDTLCGTKVLLRTDYQRLAAGRGYFGNFDPFGDFDLLFGAAKLSLKISDLPIRYRDRMYGETQIQRFRHGWMLLKMCGVGLVRLRMR